MILGIDADDVVYDFISAFKDFYCAEENIDPLSLVESRRWGFFEDWGVSMSEYKELLRKGVMEKKIFWIGEVMKGAQESLERLAREHYIIIVTHRNLLGMEKVCEDATRSWLNSNNISYDDIILTDEKTGLGFDLLLDDAVHNVQAALEAGERAVLFDRPGTQHVNYPRIKDWNQFEEYVATLDAQDKASSEIFPIYS